MTAFAFVKVSIPADFRKSHKRAGGTGMWAYTAVVADGLLCVMAGREPWKGDGKQLLHVSAIVRYEHGVFPRRQPTDAEMQAVAGLWPLKAFDEDNAESKSEHIRHLWEKR